jgi:hypothetical protein
MHSDLFALMRSPPSLLFINLLLSPLAVRYIPCFLICSFPKSGNSSPFFVLFFSIFRGVRWTYIHKTGGPSPPPNAKGVYSMSAPVSSPTRKRRGRTPADSTSTIPTVPVPTHTPPLTDQQIRVLHGVYRIILAHDKGAL